MANIDKDTTMCISIAQRPSSFGATLFNSIFGEMGMNWAYKPFRVDAENLSGAIGGVRALGIRGCGVSMPHKSEVMKYLDKIDAAAKEIGAVNTIVNENGVLTGYNTDYTGCLNSLNEFSARPKSVFIYGAGGAARALILAARLAGAKEIFIYNRTEEKAALLCRQFNCTHVRKKGLHLVQADAFFNATPIGMVPDVSLSPVDSAFLERFSIVLDVVTNPLETKLIAAARAKGKIAIPGYRMAMHQAMAQFELYTGKKPPMEFVERKILSIHAAQK